MEEPGVPEQGQRREHVLPTGQMHLVIRLREDPLRIFAGANDSAGTVVGHTLIGGARATFYSRDVSGPQCSVGAQLRPGGAEALFGIPAEEFAGRHTRLDEVWGAAAGAMRDRLAGLAPAARLDALEATLLSRAPVRAMHPAVAQALSRLALHSGVEDAIAASGYSHRTMITLFRRSVGLAPKQYGRVVRFARALQDLRTGRRLVDVALDAGYSDHAHFSREFRAFAGTTPGEYRRVAPAAAYHLRVS
jgi:AraC-like DNA-binding protein